MLMAFLLKNIICFVALTCLSYADQPVTAFAIQQKQQESMSPESLKTAYVYLNWYVGELKKNKLTDPQKKQLEDLKQQVDASMVMVSEDSSVNVHQLLQKLGELEQTLSAIAANLNVSPPPVVFCGVKPMKTTQLSVSAGSKHLCDMSHDMPKQNEPVVPVFTSSSPEFDSYKD